MFFVIAFILLLFAIIIFMNSLRFGGSAKGERRNIILQSDHYKDGQFQNERHTPALKEGMTYFGVMRHALFGKSPRNQPAHPLPSQKTDLHALHPTENVVVWFGHASYFMQVDGRKILVDPVFSGSASPLPFMIRSFKGSDVYSVADMPAIDYLFLSHDHWDHLDLATMQQLKPKVGKIITGLGVGAHLERWGFDQQLISEKDWYGQISLEEGFDVTITPARHFSGRGFRRNRTLWSSFVLKTPHFNLYLGGDSGYDHHFKQIGTLLGPFDLAILECGQYDEYWKYIHMMPEEVVQACLDLKATRLLPVHWGKFALSPHSWDDPINRVQAEADKKSVPLLTPMIGEKVMIDREQTFRKWWEDLG